MKINVEEMLNSRSVEELNQIAIEVCEEMGLSWHWKTKEEEEKGILCYCDGIPITESNWDEFMTLKEPPFYESNDFE